MKTIGLLGGMSWESTLEYYRLINEEIKERLGGLHSGKILLYSVDFYEIECFQRAGDWAGAAQALIEGARRLERGGADFLLICTNTMHKVADEIEHAIGIPLVHIADATGEAVRAAGLSKVGLLGTRFTMEEDFCKARLAAHRGIEVIIPEARDAQFVDHVIFRELCLGLIRDESRAEFVRIIEEMVKRGAQAVVLGCTEIPLLVKEKDSPVPVFDTTAIHAAKAVETALS